LTKLTAKLVGVTTPLIPLQEEGAEGLIAYCARVSNPQFQDKPIGRLFDYCMENHHWSIFEMADAIVEVEAPRDITRQMIRHTSFRFQEFSQRYSDEIEFTERDFRVQDEKNRQNSFDTFSDEQKDQLNVGLKAIIQDINDAYKALRAIDVAKECARVILPEGLTMSRLYMKGSLRSWMHYLDVREGNGTQLEHQILANKIREALLPAFPRVLGNTVNVET